MVVGTGAERGVVRVAYWRRVDCVGEVEEGEVVMAPRRGCVRVGMVESICVYVCVILCVCSCVNGRKGRGRRSICSFRSQNLGKPVGRIAER